MTFQNADFSVDDEGTILVVTPRSERFKAWVEAHVSIEGWQRVGLGGFAGDRRAMLRMLDGWSEYLWDHDVD